MLKAMVELVLCNNPRHPAQLVNKYNILVEALTNGDRDATVRAFESACMAVKGCLVELRKKEGHKAEKKTRIEAGVILMMGTLQLQVVASLSPDDKLLHAAAERCDRLVERTFAQSRFFGF